MDQKIARNTLIDSLDHEHLASDQIFRDWYCLIGSEYFSKKIMQESLLRNYLETKRIDNDSLDNFNGEDGLHVDLENNEKAYWLNFDEDRKEKITPSSNPKENFIHFFSIASPQYKISLDSLKAYENKKDKVFEEIEECVVDGLIRIENEYTCKSLGIELGNLDKIIPPNGIMLTLGEPIGILNSMEEHENGNKYLRFMTWENISVLLADKYATQRLKEE